MNFGCWPVLELPPPLMSLLQLFGHFGEQFIALIKYQNYCRYLKYILPAKRLCFWNSFGHVRQDEIRCLSCTSLFSAALSSFYSGCMHHSIEIAKKLLVSKNNADLIIEQFQFWTGMWTILLDFCFGEKSLIFHSLKYQFQT